MKERTRLRDERLFSRARPLIVERTRHIGRILRNLSTVPHRNHPDRTNAYPVKESIGFHVDFSEGQVREFCHNRARCRKSLESLEGFFGPLAELPRGCRICSPDRPNCGEKLDPSRRSEPQLHCHFSASRASASAITLSRVWPTPLAISCSPRASNKRISRCASAR
jgi:hypothetical protein